MWQSEWNAISARIAALLDAGTFFVSTRDEGDALNMAALLLRNVGEIAFALKRLLNTSGTQLPNTAAVALARFDQEFDSLARNIQISTGGLPVVAGCLAMLASFRSEFNYLLADTEAVARSLVMRAFTHLQRSIVADEVIRQRWQRAFDLGEPSCERLGACQLLAHGIWAFKTSATGERTDLVVGTRLDVNSDVQRTAEALVLTEWKRVSKPGDQSSLAEAAYRQAKRYSSGILAGFELSSRRYLILVSSDHLQLPEPRQEPEAIYEYINVAVSPSTPSEA